MKLRVASEITRLIGSWILVAVALFSLLHMPSYKPTELEWVGYNGDVIEVETRIDGVAGAIILTPHKGTSDGLKIDLMNGEVFLSG